MLGTVQAVVDETVLAFDGRKARALLGLLLLHPNEVVPVQRVIDCLWGDVPPATVDASLRVTVAKLRRGLDVADARDVVETRPTGYLIRVAQGQLDSARLRTHAADGESLLRAGSTRAALVEFELARELWHGRPLGELDGEVDDPEPVARLVELHLGAEESRLDCLIQLDRHLEAVPALEALASAHPARERLTELLVLALYRSGRQQDALTALRATSSRLRDELGLEPGPELRDLELRILRHDPSLARRRPESPTAALGESSRRGARRGRRSLAVVLGILLVGVLGAGFALASHRAPSAKATPVANSVVRIDPRTNTVAESIKVGRVPGTVLATGDAVWVSNDLDRTLSRVDLESRGVETIGGVSSVGFLAKDARGNVYASAFDDPTVWRVDPATATVVDRYRVKTRAVGIAVGGGSLWVVDRLNNSVAAFDLRTGRAQRTVAVGWDPIFTGFGYGSLWVSNSDSGSVSVVDPGIAKPRTIEGVTRPMGVAIGDGAVWIASPDGPTVTRIDPDTRKVVATIPVADIGGGSGGVYHVSVGAGGVWVVDDDDQEVIRIDPRTNRVVARISLPVEPRGVSASEDAVWVSVAAPGADYP